MNGNLLCVNPKIRSFFLFMYMHRIQLETHTSHQFVCVESRSTIEL